MCRIYILLEGLKRKEILETALWNLPLRGRCYYLVRVEENVEVVYGGKARPELRSNCRYGIRSSCQQATASS